MNRLMIVARLRDDAHGGSVAENGGLRIGNAAEVDAEKYARSAEDVGGARRTVDGCEGLLVCA